ncbi:Xre family transcriptional regulator [Bifidobacterium myosotis]|uniref:Xre family transcriptional regulator n=1 Tax=Bifidobacterium myosotis TaxID=1630166 RepID=A0A261FP42_9BIFI|nr:Xre family transcriptional regulator [Bifidobacterium myosotis]
MAKIEPSPESNGLGDYLQRVFIWNVNMQLTGRGMTQQSLCAALGLKRGAVSAKMTGKTSWTIQDIAAVAEFLNVSPLSLLDASMYEQMMRGMSSNGGASLVAVATAGFPVRATEGQAGGLKPLETKGSGPRYLVEPGAGEYPQRESNSRCQIESLVS